MLKGTVRIRSRDPGAIDRVMRRVAQLRMTVGIHAQDRDEGGGPMAVIAGVHEFGSQRVPARPFMRPTVWTNRERYLNQLRGAIRQAMRGKRSIRHGFALIGEGVVRDMQRTIRAQGEPAGSFAPLSDETKAARRRGPASLNRDAKGRFTRDMMILIDTGRLINSIRWVLSTGEGDP